MSCQKIETKNNDRKKYIRTNEFHLYLLDKRAITKKNTNRYKRNHVWILKKVDPTMIVPIDQKTHNKYDFSCNLIMLQYYSCL